MALFEIKNSSAIRSSKCLEDLIVRKKRYIPSCRKLFYKIENGVLTLHRYNHQNEINKVDDNTC